MTRVAGAPGVLEWANDVDADRAAFPAANLTGTVDDARLPDTAARTPSTGRNALTGWFHADGYGADPTGAVDSGPAINAAIADAKVAGGVVYIPAGTFKISTTIDLSNIVPTAWPQITGYVVVLRGAGRDLTILTGGEAAYGFIDLVGSVALTIQDMSMVSTGTVQYGILAGRTTGDGSSGEHKYKNISIFGSFTLAALFAMSSECCTYDNVFIATQAGPGMVLARDLRGWTASAKYTPLSATTVISGGNGVNRLRSCFLTTYGLSATDSPLTLEYVTTFVGENVYTFSSGAPSIVLAKRCWQATFRGLQQEWNVGASGATEPYGFSATNVALTGEHQEVRLSIEGSFVYPIIGADFVDFIDFSFRTSQWRGTRTYQYDVSGSYGADIHYHPFTTATSEVNTPSYRIRDLGSSNQSYPNRYTTTERNAFAYIFDSMVFDTTLNIPIWWKPSVGWVNAVGTVV